jgi:uncharacterized membrane protein YgcG
MTRMAFGAALTAAITLAVLGGCAPYGEYDHGYAGGGYYAPDYVPYDDGYGGGYDRHDHDGDRGYRGHGHDHDQNRDQNDHHDGGRDRGQHGDNRGPDRTSQTNTPPNVDRTARGGGGQQSHPDMTGAQQSFNGGGRNSSGGQSNDSPASGASDGHSGHGHRSGGPPASNY